MQDNMKEQIWFQAVSVPLSVPNAGAALDTEAKRVMWDGVAVVLKSIPSSASTPCTAWAKAFPGHLHLLQHAEVQEQRIRLGNTLIFTSPHWGNSLDKGTFVLGCKQTLEPAGPHSWHGYEPPYHHPA